MRSPFSPPLRSWRAALVAVCLSGTALVFAALANDVRQANAALAAMAGAALHNYAAAAGQGLAAELLQRTSEFRMALFEPITSAKAGVMPAPSINSFAVRAESLYRAARFDPDPLRGYLRYDLTNGSWEAEGALTDSAFAAMVTDTLRGRVAGSMVAQSGLITMSWRGTAMSTTYIPFADRVNRRAYLYVVSQTRSLAIHRPMTEALAMTPLLPPSITGHVWRAGDSTQNRGNDALVGVRVVGADGSLLYASPRWFAGPYRATYQFQAGAGGFTIETVLPPSLAEQLVPSAVRDARRSLYVGLVLVGIFLLAISAVAFWGELVQQRKARARSMSELTTGLRHELNNALASVLLEAQLLATNQDAPDDAREAGNAIAEQAERMRNVLRRLDHVEQLPVVDYFDGKSMVDLTEASHTQV
jgi:hypothetical protein